MAALTLLATVFVNQSGDKEDDNSPTAPAAVGGGLSADTATDDIAAETLDTAVVDETSEPPSASAEGPSGEPSGTTEPDPSVSPASDIDAPVTRPVGQCMATDGAVLDCAGPHASQVVSSTTACDDEILRTFLGTSDRDVLHPSLTVSALPEGASCQVLRTDGAELKGSLQAAFEDPRSAVAAEARHCVTIDLDPVGCTGPHHGEVVGETESSAECLAITAEFLGRGGSNLPANLSLTARSGRTVECIVTVKGANTLTHTLRDIGQRALPIEPSS